MKRAVFCLQNELIEASLSSKNIIGPEALIIRKTEELTLKKLDEFVPDIIFFPHWSTKVPNEILEKYDCICFHSTPLPFGRGGSPIQNMISKGFKSTEVCSLLMVEKFDAGPIFLRTEVGLHGNLREILERIYNIIGEQIKILLEKEIIPEEQIGEPTFFPRLSGKENMIVDKSTLEEVYDKIRMLDSELYPSAYIHYEGFLIEFTDADYNEQEIKAKVTIKLKNKDD